MGFAVGGLEQDTVPPAVWWEPKRCVSIVDPADGEAVGLAVGGLKGGAVGFVTGPAGAEAVGLAVGGLLGSAVGPVERLRGLRSTISLPEPTKPNGSMLFFPESKQWMDCT